jgi:hypothetical protein
MNRLSPLVARHYRHPGRARPAAIGGAAAAAPAPGADLRLFVTAWLGGVVFFTTFLA